VRTRRQVANDNKKAKNEVNERPNSAIYVTGIPLDAEFDDINNKFKKYGLVEEDIHTGLPKIKMYADDQGVFKGDARISMESITVITSVHALMKPFLSLLQVTIRPPGHPDAR